MEFSPKESRTERLGRSFLALTKIYQARWGRFLAAIPPTTLLTVAGAVVTIALSYDKTKHPESYFIILVAVIGLLGLLLMIIQGVMEFLRRKYDVTLALRYCDLFFNDMISQRYAAANALDAVLKADSDETLEHLSRKSELEPVLDVIEDLGFLVNAYQISFEVAHHYFYHWIVLYVQPIEKYLLLLRRKCPAKYKSILPLFDQLRLIEGREMKHGFWVSLDLKRVNFHFEGLAKAVQDEIDDCEPPKPLDQGPPKEIQAAGLLRWLYKFI